MGYVNPEPELGLDSHAYVNGTCDHCKQRGTLVEYWAQCAGGYKVPVLALCFEHAFGDTLERGMLRVGASLGGLIELRARQAREELSSLATEFLRTHQENV